MRALDLQAPLREQEHGGNHVRDLFDIPDELEFLANTHIRRVHCVHDALAVIRRRSRSPERRLLPVSQRAEDSTNSAIPAAIEAFSELILPFCSMRAT